MKKIYKGILFVLMAIALMSLFLPDAKSDESRYILYMTHTPGKCRVCHFFLASEYSRYRESDRDDVLPLKILVSTDLSTWPKHFLTGKISSIKTSIPTFIIYDLQENREAGRIEGYYRETFYEQLDVLMEAIGVQNP